MTPTTLYQAALAATENHHVASHTLPNGDEVFCWVQKVAGQSQVRKHLRTNWGLRKSGEPYQNRISHAAAASILRIAN
jgi:hypothetical protein